MMVRSLEPMGSSAVGPALGSMVTVVRTRTMLGVTTTMAVAVAMTGTTATATATSPGY